MQPEQTRLGHHVEQNGLLHELSSSLWFSGRRSSSNEVAHIRFGWVVGLTERLAEEGRQRVHKLHEPHVHAVEWRAREVSLRQGGTRKRGAYLRMKGYDAGEVVLRWSTSSLYSTTN